MEKCLAAAIMIASGPQLGLTTAPMSFVVFPSSDLNEKQLNIHENQFRFFFSLLPISISHEKRIMFFFDFLVNLISIYVIKTSSCQLCVCLYTHIWCLGHQRLIDQRKNPRKFYFLQVNLDHWPVFTFFPLVQANNSGRYAQFHHQIIIKFELIIIILINKNPCDQTALGNFLSLIILKPKKLSKL